MRTLVRQSVTLSACALGLLLGLVAPLPAAAPPGPTRPRDELLRFVREDVGFCLVIQDMRAHAANLARSPFAQHFRRSAVGKALAGSAELRKLEEVDKRLAKQVGLGWAGLRDD